MQNFQLTLHHSKSHSFLIDLQIELIGTCAHTHRERGRERALGNVIWSHYFIYSWMKTTNASKGMCADKQTPKHPFGLPT